ESRVRLCNSHRLEQPRHSDGVEFGGQHWLLPRCRDERLGGQVVDLIGLYFSEKPDERELIKEIRLLKFDTSSQMSNTLEIFGARPSNHAHDAVALLEEKLGEVGAILARDPRDECRAVHTGHTTLTAQSSPRGTFPTCRD